MAISLRVTGSWAELIADGTVAIPATPQVGDRMFLFARWKDFSITATVANWTELTEFADGAVASSNGTGSVKVGCWWRDWQAGDADPTLDFSTSPTTASVVIMVMAKGTDDVWQTPAVRTAAMTNWTTSSQSVAASATVTVPSSSVVMGLIGIRDDTATMTRPTSGIDDSGGLVTWNGNYVESPATHHSTTTGDDGAADLGYRLVTTGAAGVTLRLTGTISAAETGSALWVVQGVSVQVTPSTATLTSSRFAPTLKLVLTPATLSVTTTKFTAQLRLAVTPAVAALSTSRFAPSLRLLVTPPATTLTTTRFVPQLRLALTPTAAALSTTGLAPTLSLSLTPAAVTLTIASFAPSLPTVVVISTTSLTITTTRPHVLPFRLVFLDPGGDAVQAPGYFNTLIAGSSGAITFDTAQKVVGVGSYKFDSEDGELSALSVPDVLGGEIGSSRRISTYFRYDSVPDDVQTEAEFFLGDALTAYSGGGFSDPAQTQSDSDNYATATPARNAGQGTVTLPLSPVTLPLDAIIDSVKIIYERHYDVDTSIGISRVKWRVDGEEGPNHDNTDMPLTDTVVEVDVTADRAWERQYLVDGRFEVIAEARRGDTDTVHTQSWDYVKVEVQYHAATVIMQGRKLSDNLGFCVALRPQGDGAVLRLLDIENNAYDGITELAINTQNRIALCYTLLNDDELGINLYVNGVPELSIIASIAALSINWPLHLDFGWVRIPGVDHLCWFDQLYIDDGDDLQDPGNMLLTAKLPASVNENNWDTTGGTGAVDERPLSETNYMQHTAFSAVRQTYTLQDAATGDVDISGETLVGHMEWTWGKVGPNDVDAVYSVFNGVDRFFNIGTTPSLNYAATASVSYPSDPAGVGMVSNGDIADTYFYEGGSIVAYEGPSQDDSLFPFQLLTENSLTPVVDDLRTDLPSSYELRYRVDEAGAQVVIIIYSISSEDAEPQLVSTSGSNGGNGQVIINSPGIELRIYIVVTGGATSVGLRRFLNPE